jgi:predicted amidohydrolase YtcJ
VIDGAGGALLPGLHDHHLHLLAMAAARTSLVVGPPAVDDVEGLRRALRRADAALPSDAWVRAVGYHESVAGELDRDRLDDLLPHRPVRVQHRSGACWIVNGLAAHQLGLDDATEPGVEHDERGRATGRIYGADDWLGDRVPRAAPDVAAVLARLAAFGITAVTDATPTERAEELAVLATAAGGPAAPVAVTVTGGPGLPDDASPELRRGPVKLVMADHALPGWDEVVAGFQAARRRDRAVAVHCVTRVGLLLALAVWEEVGVRPGDRIEHGAVVPLETVPRLAELGLTVVTQPHFVRERGDAYRRDVDPDDRPDLWRCASLLDAGVPVGGSSDAPFGHDDPWAAMAAAVDRRTPDGSPLGPAEAVTPAAALALYLAPLTHPGGPARRVAVGAPADCCLLDRPLAAALADPAFVTVVATTLGGRLTHRR